MIVLSVGMLCGIFQKEVFHWILSDEMIIARAGDYLWMIVLLVLVKIPYRIRLLYLQGIGKEGQVFWITAAASVIFGVEVNTSLSRENDLDFYFTVFG